MKKLVISMKHWLRNGTSISCLRNKSGSMCCLGFLARDCGADVSDILDKPSPRETPKLNWPVGIFNSSGNISNLTNDIIYVNDSIDFSLKEKQFRLKKLFKQIGYQLLFK